MDLEDPACKAFKGHTNHILTLAYSPDGVCIATGSADKTIRVWEVITGHQVGMSLVGHTCWVRAIAYSPDGLRLASSSDDGTLRVWNMKTCQTIMGPLEGHTSCSHSAVQYSPDGAFIASGGDDGLLKLWDARVGHCVVTLEYPVAVRSVSFSPNSKHVASACDDGLVRIYDVDQQKPVRELAGHDGSYVRCVQYSPDGSIIATATNDCTIWLWDAWTGDRLKEPLCGHLYHVSGISFSYDGQLLISSSADETIRVWDIASGECVLGPLWGHEEPINAIVCSADREHVASFSNNGVRIWSIHGGTATMLRPLAIPESSIQEDDISSIHSVYESAEGRNTATLTRAFQWFLGNNARNSPETESVQLDSIIEVDIGGFVDEDTAEIIGDPPQLEESQVATTYSDRPNASLQVMQQPLFAQESSGSVEATSSDIGRAQEQRPNLPAIESSDSLGSFMNRPAIITNRNHNFMDNFFDDVETNDYAQQLHPSEETQQNAEDLEQRNIAVIMTRTFTWVRDRLPGRRNGVGNTFRKIWTHTANTWRSSNVNGQDDSERPKLHFKRTMRQTMRAFDIVSPAYGFKRNVAARDRDEAQTGRRTNVSDTSSDSTESDESDQRGTTAREEAGLETRLGGHAEVSDTCSDAASLEESHHPIRDALCCCTWLLPRTHRQTEAHHAGRQEEPTPTRKRASVAPVAGGAASAPRQADAASSRLQMRSTSVPEHTYPPLRVQVTEEPLSHTQVPRFCSVGVQTVETLSLREETEEPSI